jgi:CheY-like chemotaxis protein
VKAALQFKLTFLCNTYRRLEMNSPPKLLLFEDDSKNAKIIKAACRKSFDIVWVKNEDELDAEIKDDFDVIISDVRIRGTDRQGHQIIEDIRRKYKISRIPVILYSGVLNVFEIEKERGRLFFAYVDKGDIDFANQLLSKASEAATEKENLISYIYFETRFSQMGKFDESLEKINLIDNLSFITDITQIKTVRDLITQMKKDDMEIEILDALEDIAWKILKEFQKEKSDN